jgi:hypothetical protein
LPANPADKAFSLNLQGFASLAAVQS